MTDFQNDLQQLGVSQFQASEMTPWDQQSQFQAGQFPDGQTPVDPSRLCIGFGFGGFCVGMCGGFCAGVCGGFCAGRCGGFCAGVCGGFCAGRCGGFCGGFCAGRCGGFCHHCGFCGFRCR